MFKNYLTIAVRNLLKHKVFSFINITGLAVGMASCLLIALYVKDELSYDNYHPNKDRTYRVVSTYKNQNVEQRYAIGEHKLAPLFKTDFPEFETVTRIGNVASPVHLGEKVIQENNLFIADANIFDVFDFSFIQGDPHAALREPFTMVITETTARRYFGDTDPMNRTLMIDTMQFRISAVIHDAPRNTHFHPDLIMSMATERSMFPDIVFKNWGELSVYTYVILTPGTSADAINGRLEDFVKKHVDEQSVKTKGYALQPLTRIHLENYNLEMETNGNGTVVTMFLLIALGILFMASINYMNLATARSALRSKEVGVRKVLGAGRRELVRQFMGESVLLAMISFVIAVGLAELYMPAFNGMANKTFTLASTDWKTWIALTLLAVVIGLLSGYYPALFLSKFQTITILKSQPSKGTRGVRVRKLFVVFQFAISVALIIGTTVIYRQMKFLKDKELGFASDQLLMVGFPNETVLRQYESLKGGLLMNPGVLSVSMASKPLAGRLTSHLGFKAEGVAEETSKKGIAVVAVGFDFFRTIGVPIVEGRDFSKAFSTDAEDAFIVNETAVHAFDWTASAGKAFQTSGLNEKSEWYPKKGRIIGVVKDFHYESLHQKIEPIVFYLSSTWGGYVLIKVRGGEVTATLEKIKSTWNEMTGGQPFEYSFVDEKVAALYRSEERLSRIIQNFAAFAVFIACLGIFGLAAFTAEQRTKEIGIRKVLGATTLNILAMLSKDFAGLVLIANVAAWPVAYYAMNGWLQDFAYRVPLAIWMFIFSGATVLLIAMITVSYQARKAATANPVEALKYE